jgi:outer membrane protein
MSCSRLALFVYLLSTLVPAAWSQTPEHSHERYKDMATPRVVAGKLSAPAHLQKHVVDGKLQLSLQDAVVLTLENNSLIRVQETQVDTSKFTILGLHSPFDPVLTSSYNITSSIASPFSTLQGTGGLNVNVKDTAKFLQFNYSQTFESGTNVQAFVTNSYNSINNSFYFLNPYITSTLSFQFTQPLLRNGWLFANRAPLIIARRNLEQTQAAFAAQVNNNILQAVQQYWAVIAARGNLEVARRSMDAAEATYKHDKRALELGALPPLDIYRSESQVASRRVQVIQSEYALKESEDTLRFTIGADQDPYFEALDMELTEKPEPDGELLAIDVASALHQALDGRPEFVAARAALSADDVRIRLARNHRLPELDLMALYASNGVGGSQINTAGQTTSTSSVSQLFGFGFPTYEAQLSLTLPIRNRAAQAELGNALVSRSSDLYNQRQVHEQVTLDVSNAVHQLEQAKLGIAAGKDALDLARKTMAAEQRKYELGSSTIFLVLEAQTELAAAEQSLIQAEVGYQLAVAGIDHATGKLLQPYQIQIEDLTR